MVPSSRLKHVSLVTASLAVAVPLAGLALTGGAPSAAAAVRHAQRLTPATTAACPKSGGISFAGSLSNGMVKLGSSVSGSGVTGKVCGILKVASSGFSVSIPKANISFAPTHVTILGLASLPATIAAAGKGTGRVTAGPKGTFNTKISVPVTSTVSALGFQCTVGPFTPVLTTGTSGSVRGKALSGTLSKLQGKLAAGEFSVPAVQASATCPFLVAGLVNTLAGFPLKAGQSTLTASTTLSVG